MEIKEHSPLVSVIVPVYNTAHLVERCINSILQQTYLNWELLLIDDGSTDNSLSICQKYTLKDNRIRLYHKENGGVSSARNMGLDNARGDIITFVDADDWIKDSFIETAITNISRYDIDLYQVSWCLKYDFTTEDYKSGSRYMNLMPLEIVDFLKLRFKVGIGGNFFRSSIIDKFKLRFIDGLKLAEDQLFLYTYMYYSKVFALSKDFDYCYYRNPGSATHIATSNTYLESIRHLSRFKYRQFFKPHIEKSILSQFIFLIYSSGNNVTTRELYEVIATENFPIELLRYNLSNSNKLFLLCSLISKKFAISIIRLVNRLR